MRSAGDARSKILAGARLSRHVMERGGALMTAGAAAAATDPEIRAMWETGMARRLDDLSRVAADLWATGELRPELGADGTIDVLWTMTGPEVYKLLTVDRGWTPERYEAWLGESLVRLLVLPTAADLSATLTDNVATLTDNAAGSPRTVVQKPSPHRPR